MSIELKDAGVAVATAVVFGAKIVFDISDSFFSGWRKTESTLVKRIKIAGVEIEAKGPSALPLIESAARVLDLASDRQALLLVKSERRLQRLYTVGTWLVTLSVIVPFVLVAIYLSSDPAST